MKYEEISGRPIGEVIGAPCVFVNPTTKRKIKGKVCRVSETGATVVYGKLRLRRGVPWEMVVSVGDVK